MSSGDRLLDASGNVILDASGNIQLSDGAGDSCCCCNYIQARNCNGDSLLDAWKLASGLTLPYYWTTGGGFGPPLVCGYFKAGNPCSNSPGTILTGETSISACGAGVCGCSNCPDVIPDTFTVTVSGHSLSCGCQLTGTGGGYQVTGDVNGTYCLTRATDCSRAVNVSGLVSFTAYGSGCSSALRTGDFTRFVMFRNSGTTWQFRIFCGTSDSDNPAIVFDGTTSATNCNASVSFTNSLTSCGTATYGISGSASATVGC